MAITASQLVARARERIREIGAETLAGELGKAPIIIDVREPHEFAVAHVYGAVNIPRGVLEFEVTGHPAVASIIAPELQIRDAPVYLYCRSGARSALAADALQNMGFTKVFSLAGGFLAWQAGGHPTQVAHPEL